MKTITFKNNNCTFTFNLETKHIFGSGNYANHFFRSYNETTRGVKGACKELQNVFNESSTIYSVIDFLSSKKIMMTFSLS